MIKLIVLAAVLAAVVASSVGNSTALANAGGIKCTSTSIESPHLVRADFQVCVNKHNGEMSVKGYMVARDIYGTVAVCHVDKTAHKKCETVDPNTNASGYGYGHSCPNFTVPSDYKPETVELMDDQLGESFAAGDLTSKANRDVEEVLSANSC